jgi:hypothetical protein
LLAGESVWLLLHLEVQSQPESNFAERVFTYNFRIFDLYHQVPVSLAILCDDQWSWRPQNYAVTHPDTQLLFNFGITKLLDWRDRVEELTSSENLFAIVVLAHLKVIETKSSIQQRQAWKFRLTKMLYERGYERQQIVDLYRFIDWVMILPEAQEREFWRQLQAYEEETKVTYVTNAERFGFERGIQEGIQQGEQRGRQEEGCNFVFRQLTRRLGQITSQQEIQIRALSLSQLEDLGEALLDFTQPSDLEEWLQSHR